VGTVDGSVVDLVDGRGGGEDCVEIHLSLRGENGWRGVRL
jgi:hypothetical protein